MKTKLIFVFMLLSCAVIAQDFEGTIRWSMKMDITDPKVKAQMEEAEKKMKDPATQAQFKQMQEKMKDPEFKKMMDANPQMKAQMDAALKMMQGGSMSSLIPTGFMLKTKGGNSLTKMEGGVMSGIETLMLKDKDESYLINREDKTYSVIKHTESASAGTHDPAVKITKTAETQKILNYTCKKTIATITEQGQTFTQIFWTTNEIPNLDFKKLASQKMGSGKQSVYYKELEGVPLKMEMTMPQGTMVMQVTEIKKQSLPGSDFQIPTGFTKTTLPGQ